MTPNDELSIESQIEATTQRLHMLEPILQALEQPHRVLDVLLEAKDAEAGRSALTTEFGLDTIQATAVMDAQFRRVTHADRDKIRKDVAETRALLDRLRESP
jgi:DNA gyrase subunit A